MDEEWEVVKEGELKEMKRIIREGETAKCEMALLETNIPGVYRITVKYKVERLKK